MMHRHDKVCSAAYDEGRLLDFAEKGAPIKLENVLCVCQQHL